MEELLVVQNLRKTFAISRKQQKLEKTKEKVRVAVDDLSFTAYRGEVFGLLGPNGAGKTTTLRIMATLIRPDAGDVLVDGSSVCRDPEDVRTRIGFLTSELKLEDFFTPNYLFDFFSELHGVEPDVCKARKQMLFDPEIIIFDEPTNGLDVLTAKVVTDFLLELKAQGKTIIVSTHIFSLIEKICDRVGVMIGGRMAVCGTLAEICAGKTLEDRFFDIYREMAGETV